MTYRGRVKNGVVVLDEPDQLPEGVTVDVTVRSDETTSPNSLADRLLKHAGTIKNGLPADLAEKHDHYLHRPETQ